MDADVLRRESVITGLPSVAKDEAIRYVGNLLVEMGAVGPDYVDAMVERDGKVLSLIHI